MSGVEEQQNKQVVVEEETNNDADDNDLSVLVLKLRGHKMKNVDGFLGRRDTSFSLVQTVDNWFGKSDPFFQVSNAHYRRVQQSPVIHDNLNPDWPTLAIPLDFLLLGNTHDPDNQQFFITFYDWEEDGHHQFMGHVATTVQELLQHAPPPHSDNNNKKRHGFLRSSGRTKKQEPAFQLQVDGIHYGSIFVDEARVVSQKEQQQQQQPSTHADRSMNDFIDITNVKVMKDGKQVQYTHEEIFQQEIMGGTDNAAAAPTNEIASRSINLTTTTTPEHEDGVAVATAEAESSNRDTDAPPQETETTNAETSTKDLADNEKDVAITEPVTEPAPLVASPSDEELLSNEEEDLVVALPENVPFASNEQAKGPPIFDMDLVVDNDDSPIKLQRGMTNANEVGVSTRAVIGPDEAQSLTETDDDDDDKLDAPLESEVNDSKEIEIEFGAEQEDAVRDVEDVLLDGLLSDDADDDLVFENDDPAPAQSLIFATPASPSKKEAPLPKKPVPDYVAKFKGVTLDSVESGDLEPEEEEPELLQEEEEEEPPMAPDSLFKGSIEEPTMDEEEESSKPSEEPVSELETSKPPEDVVTTKEETTKPFEETSMEEETTKPFEETQMEEETTKPLEEAAIEEEISEEPAIEKETIKPADDSPTEEEPAVVDTPIEQESSKLVEDTTTTTTKAPPPSKPVVAKPTKDPLSSSTRSTRSSKMETLASSTRSTGRSMLGSSARTTSSRATTSASRTSRIPKTSTTTTKKSKKKTTESSSNTGDKTNPSRRAAMEKSLSVPRIARKPAAPKKTRVTPTRSNSSSRLGSVVQNRPRVVRPSDGSNVFERLYRKDTACYNARRVNKEYFTAQQN